jgi:hypothetical protein
LKSLFFFTLGLMALIAATYCRVLFLGETFVLRDALRFSLPSREFLAGALAAGRIPEWFDGVGFGVAFAANPVHGVVAPLGWLLGILPTPLGFDLYTLLHLLLAGMGTAAFSRRLGASAEGSFLAAGALALGGYVSSVLTNGMAPIMAWTPWVAWAADRFALAGHDTLPDQAILSRLESGATLAAAFALQLLAGEPASLLIAALLALIVIAARSRRPLAIGTALLIPGVASLALAAVALWPGLCLLKESARAAGLDGGGMRWSMHPARMVEWIWPLAFGSPRGDGWFAGLLLAKTPDDPFWSFNLYIGLPVLLLAVAAARDQQARRLFVAAAIFVFLAFGRFNPLYEFLQRAFLPVRISNFPEKYIFGALILWSALAGVGFTRAVQGGPGRRLVITASAGAVALALAIVAFHFETPTIAGLLALRVRAWQLRLNLNAGLAATLFGGVAASVGAAVFAIALWLRALRKPWRGAPVLAALGVLAPLILTDWAATPLVRRALIDEAPALLRVVPRPSPDQALPRPRVFRLHPLHPAGPFASGKDMARDIHETLDTNVASRYGFDILPGFESGDSARSRLFWMKVVPRMAPASFTGLLGIDYVVVQEANRLRSPLPTAAPLLNVWSVHATGPVRPRAFVAPRWLPAAAASEAVEALAIPGREVDLGRIVLVHPDPRLPQNSGPLLPCQVRTPRPEEVQLDCPPAAGGYAVLLDEASPGWTATVDGRDAEILIADGLFRAVPVGPGSHRVVFRYRTPGLRAGAAISLAAWGAWGVFIFMVRRHRRASPAGPASG